MKRLDVLKAVAALPLLGGLLASPLAQESEAIAQSELFEGYGEGELHMFAGVTDNGQYYSTQLRLGWPDAQTIESFAQRGFDRFEILNGSRVIYQAPTTAGRVPIGWDSLEHTGYIK
jgi:hypothetical protein